MGTKINKVRKYPSHVWLMMTLLVNSGTREYAMPQRTKIKSSLDFLIGTAKYFFIAEAVRFELTDPVKSLLFSRQVPSTTQPRLLLYFFDDIALLKARLTSSELFL